MKILAAIVSLVILASVSAAEVSSASGPGAIDSLLQRAISARLISGGVVLVGNHQGTLCVASRGQLDDRPGAPPLGDRTIFDLASLTKVIATAPAVMKLADQGKLSLSEPVSRWFPEFRGKGITVLDLLTHTSGLSDFSLRRGESIRAAVRKAAAERGLERPGRVFNYADINFIILGELVRRVSGKPLDIFSRDELYGPLGASETMFLPPRDLACFIAPTAGFRSGTVEDGVCRRLGGVAGHAGLFSSARDLGLFARMILGSGAVNGKRLLSERAVEEMTAPRSFAGGRVRRGLGWDIASSYSAPRGLLFSDLSFGHTGYSGSSIWIDPKTDLFVVLLTNRRCYRDPAAFNRFRSDVSTLAAAGFGPGGSAASVAAREAEMADPQRYFAAAPRHPSRRMVLASAERRSSSVRSIGKRKGKDRRRKGEGGRRRA